MSTALVQELEQLLRETGILLACPDPDFETWKEYGARRAAIFARLQEMDFQGEGEVTKRVSVLLHEILAQDAILMERAEAQLTHLREILSTLAASRRALRGYAPSLPAPLFERCA
jgi:Flagellar protein FliT